MEPDTTLRDWVREHRVTWELSPWQELVEHRPAMVGFELRLFARHARFKGLAELHDSAWQAPLPRKRLEPTSDQDHPAIADNHGADTNDRPIGILSIGHSSPMTFTMTRFRRWPSNSA